MKNKILVLTVVILGLMLNFSAIMAQELPASDDVLFSNELQAVAGDDRNVVVGRQVLFSGNASLAPDVSGVEYFWDFGDGTTARGSEVVHIYNKPGVYRATLTLFLGQAESVDEIIVSVDRDIAILITDSDVTEDGWKLLQEKASTQETLLVNIKADESSVEYVKIS